MTTLENRGNKTWRLTVKLSLDSNKRRIGNKKRWKHLTYRECPRPYSKPKRRALLKKWTCLNVIWINLKGDNRVLETQGDQEIYKNNECAVKIIKNALEKEPWMLFYVGALLGGLRQSELNKLRWSDINYDDNSISIKQANRASIKITMPNWYMDELKLHQVTRKTDIYLVHADHGLRISEVWFLRRKRLNLEIKRPHQRAWALDQHPDYLKYANEVNEYLFYQHGKIMTVYPFKRILTELSQYAGISKHICPHDLRRTAAYLMQTGGIKIVDIQHQLRHINVGTTLRYVPLLHDLAKIVEDT